MPLTLTITPDHSHGYPGFKAIVRRGPHALSVSYGHRSYSAARVSGERRMAQEPELTVGAMRFRVSA